MELEDQFAALTKWSKTGRTQYFAKLAKLKKEVQTTLAREQNRVDVINSKDERQKF